MLIGSHPASYQLGDERVEQCFCCQKCDEEAEKKALEDPFSSRYRRFCNHVCVLFFIFAATVHLCCLDTDILILKCVKKTGKMQA